MTNDDPSKILHTPVLIAGGGPVGLTLAMSLAKRDIRCIVLESRADIPPNPRCNTTNARSMEIFRLLGCADAIRDAGLPADHSTDVVYMTDLAGAELTRFVRPTTGEVRAGTAEGIGASWPTPEPQHFISQLYMEPVLREHAAQQPNIDLRLGWRLLEFAQTEDAILAVAEDIQTGNRVQIIADYIVGADGSTSLVRHTIGASLEGMPALENTTSVFFRSARVNELYERTPGWMYRFPGGAMLVAISTDEWLIHTQVPRGEDPTTFDYEPQMFQSLGERVEYEVISISRWTARAMVSNKFVEGRAVLAGDAAHIWIPMGGFGMNAGIGDADALGWRLAGLIQGWLSAQVLRSYEMERASLGVQVAAQAPKWRAAIQPIMQAPAATWSELRDPANRELRDAFGDRIQQANLSEWESVGIQLGFAYEHSPIIVPDGESAPPFSVEDYRESSVPGVRAPHIWRAQGGRSLFDDFGLGFTLLRLGPNPPTGAQIIALASERRIPLTVLDVPEPEAVAKYGAYGLVVVRPDQYIAWRSKGEPTDPAAVLDTLTAHAMPVPDIPERRSHTLATRTDSPTAIAWEGGVLVTAFADGLAGFDPTTREWTRYVRGNDDATPPPTPHPSTARDGAQPPSYVAVDAGAGAQICFVSNADDALTPVLSHPLPVTALALSPSGGTLYVRDQSGVVQQARVLAGGGLGRLYPFVSSAVPDSSGMSVDTDGAVWVCRARSDVIDRYDAAGRLVEHVTTPPGPVDCVVADQLDGMFIVGHDGSQGWIAEYSFSGVPA
ncbi:FAD-dependent monooxygenase [Microbacterium deminutum]|uniref:FAD-binding domain-containing protein n=1 Tax=Microbacterium deminutum TaxID=344164 RepID=A0ABN2RI45_9MICO